MNTAHFCLKTRGVDGHCSFSCKEVCGVIGGRGKEEDLVSENLLIVVSENNYCFARQ